MSSHGHLKQLETSKSPTVLKGITTAANGEDLIFNQHSSADVAPSHDVNFEYLEGEDGSSFNQTPPEATSISLKELAGIKLQQKVNVVATLSLGDLDPKPIVTSKTGMETLVKEDCVLEDKSGSAPFHIWGAMISQLENG